VGHPSSFGDDVAATKLVLEAQNRPVIFVGHSYGGVVITEAGNDPKVIELVYVAAFAPDLDAEKAAFIADSQVPWGVDALRGTISKAAWRTKPSWYLVASEDQMIPPAAQRFMSKRAGSTIVEVAGSRAIYVSQPNAVAALIEKAAREVKAVAN